MTEVETEATLQSRKLELLQSLRNRTGAPHNPATFKRRTVSLEVAGVQARIECRGIDAENSAKFLKRYLEPFALKEDSSGSDGVMPMIEMITFTGGGPERSPLHPVWNTVLEQFETFPEADGSSVVRQRDFAAWSSPDGLRIEAVVPALDAGCVDSIDNLMMFALSRHLPHAEALALHAATVERAGRAYVFFGASGAGKSTLAKHCFDTDGLRVLSGDQIYLSVRDGHLTAHPCPTTIWEFPRGHAGWCSDSLPVAGLFHLVQRGGYGFRTLTAAEALTHFLRETIYHPLFGDARRVLELAMWMIDQSPCAAEFSYPKGVSFWAFLLDHLDHEQALIDPTALAPAGRINRVSISRETSLP